MLYIRKVGEYYGFQNILSFCKNDFSNYEFKNSVPRTFGDRVG